MNMIEVDPKLFITCRLCLDETGQYQIVPEVQKQIKYCFDIEVEPFDGLPQLICKKCENILSQHVGIKQIFQEKQCNLKSRVKDNRNDLSHPHQQQQQNSVSSTNEADEILNTSSSVEKDNNTGMVPLVPNSKTFSIEREPCKDKSNLLSTKPIYFRPAWKRDYDRHFICRFCNKSLKIKSSITQHLKRCNLLLNYSNVIKKSSVQMKKIDSGINFTHSNENVVCTKERIVQSRDKNYFVLYTLKQNDQRYVHSDLSDEDFIVAKKKRKRCRILSKSSNETLIIDENYTSKSFILSDSDEKHDDNAIRNETNDIEYVDSDTDSTLSVKSNNKAALNNIEASEIEEPEKTIIENDKITNIQTIITMCCDKYLKRQIKEGKNLNSSGNDDFMQRKILSIGRKVVHDKGLNSSRLIRYLEQKDLDVHWIPKTQTNVTIKTTLKDEENCSNLKTLGAVYDSYKPKDFVDILEETLQKSHEVSNICTETLRNEDKIRVINNTALDTSNVMNTNLSIYLDNNAEVDNSTSNTQCTPDAENQNMLKKLLNVNPVANPKQLPKKLSQMEISVVTNVTSLTSSTNNKTLLNSSVSNLNGNVNNTDKILSMPIITSTVSLAGPLKNMHNNTSQGNSSQATKKIVVNDKQSQVATLPPPPAQPRIKVKPVSELMPENCFNRHTNTVQPTRTWPIHFIHDDNFVNAVNNVPSCSIVNCETWKTASPSQNNINQPSQLPAPSCSNASSQLTQQFVTMHTVELPNKRTKSPFRYFKELLQLHNIILLDSIDIDENLMCLIKFKLVFHQEPSAGVTLCLSLFYNNNTFYIRVRDIESKNLDITRLSAYWQWEILKEFKGHIVSKLYENANRLGQDVFTKTNYFVSLLGSIVFRK